jgi:hypothetical protein
VQTTATDVCSAPYDSLSNGFDGYDSATRGYLTDTITANYKTAAGTALNPASGLVLHTTDGASNACIEAGGNTSYSEALRQAQAELLAHGRANVPNYIVFLTDGEANIGSVYPGTTKNGVFTPDPKYPPGNSDDTNPCQTAIDLANSYKAAGTTIYAIGYALGSDVACTQGAMGVWVPAAKVKGKNVAAHWDPCVQTDPGCEHYASSTDESPYINSFDTLDAIASDKDFYNQPTAGELDTIFAAIASDIASGSSRLVDDGF